MENTVVLFISLMFTFTMIVLIGRSYYLDYRLDKKAKVIDTRFQNACIERKMITYGFSREQADIYYRWEVGLPVSDEEKQSHREYVERKNQETLSKMEAASLEQ